MLNKYLSTDSNGVSQVSGAFGNNERSVKMRYQIFYGIEDNSPRPMQAFFFLKKKRETNISWNKQAYPLGRLSVRGEARVGKSGNFVLVLSAQKEYFFSTQILYHFA